MWREELGLVEMLFTYIGDFAKFESYADWRPVLVDILTSHEEVRRRRLDEASEYSSGERMKDDEVEDFVFETRQPFNDNVNASLHIPTEERSNAYSQSSMEYSFDVNREENDYFIESNRMAQRLSECVTDTINKEDDVVVKEETAVQDSVSQMSEESIVCLDMETRGDNAEFGNVAGAPEIANVNALSKINEQDIRQWRAPGNFNCHVCGKSYVSKQKLTRHMIYHTKAWSYKCDTCDKSFFSNCDLKRHSRIHSGERPFLCHLCGKGFSQKSVLLIHMKRHFNERPFPCQLCTRAFYKKCELKSHIKSCHDSQMTKSSNPCK